MLQVNENRNNWMIVICVSQPLHKPPCALFHSLVSFFWLFRFVFWGGCTSFTDVHTDLGNFLPQKSNKQR